MNIERRRSRLTAAAACLGVAFLPGSVAGQSEPVTYAELAPVFQERCVICHAGEAAPLGLRLDSYQGLLEGSANGPVVKDGDPAGSELIRRIRGTSQPRMPLTGPPYLSEETIDRFERWVAAGMPEGAVADAPAPEAETAARPAPGEPVTYRHVAPIFAQRCVKCHAERGLMGLAPEGYRLTSYEAALSPADRVRIVPGRPEASELLRRIRGQSLPRMPFDGPPFLAEDEIALVERWIAGGARNAEGRPAAVPAGAEVRLHGTLTGRWRLDGLELNVTRGTRIDKSPGVGDYVQVRGVLDRDGNVRVERLRRR